jgi:phenylalanyl-tRNA synthetase beta chain
LDNLLQLIGQKLTPQKLEDTLFLLKVEIEKLEGNILEVEVNPDRQDMLSAEGISRAIRAFLGIESGLRNYPVKKSEKQIVVKPGLEKVRPLISCGIVKGIQLNDDLLKDYMHLQELLTTTHGRNRKKASIGLYVLNDIEFPVIYAPEKPESIKFAPLGQEAAIDGPTILKTHEKGLLYGPIISGFKKWPLLKDSKDHILSLPPVINSNDLGRITVDIHDIFVEVTGTQKSCVDQALNIVLTSLADRGGKIESVTVVYPDGTETETPDLRPSKMVIATDDVVQLTGLKLQDQDVVDCLKRMCYGAKMISKGKIAVEVPPFRTDILHSVDVLEDVAIGYGFDRIQPTMPVTTTAGRLLPKTRQKNKARDLMVGVGYQEVMTYVMSSPDIMNSKMKRDSQLVTTGNPKSIDYSVLRNSLLPALLDFTSQNQHADHPHRVFEVGDVVTPDQEQETRTSQKTSVCGLVSDARVNLTNLIAELTFVLRNLGLEGKFRFVSATQPSFVDGRNADIMLGQARIGSFGEVSPEVLSQFGIGSPTVAFEFWLE